VHLELTHSLTSEEFILSFRRFTARRGVPSIVYSDNAKTFKGAQSKIQNLYGSLIQSWKWITPRAPWHGGFWERMVKCVKSALKKSIVKGCLTLVELQTVIVEIEYCVNSRPLTVVSDVSSMLKPLTPNDFLFFHKNNSNQVVDDSCNVNRNILLVKQQDQLKVLEKFWSIWSQSYLKSLPAAVHKFKEYGSLNVGSIVKIQEDNVQRLEWPHGTITELILSRDGVARSVKVKTGRGENQSKHAMQPGESSDRQSTHAV